MIKWTASYAVLMGVVLLALLSGCGFDPSRSDIPPFFTPDEEATIRRILKANGYDVADDYLRDPHSNAKYIAILSNDNWSGKSWEFSFPRKNNRTDIVLTDDITRLSKTKNGFKGISINSNASNFFDTLVIQTDSVIILPRIDLLGQKFRSIPASIGKLRCRHIWFYHNEFLKSIPDEVMDLSKAPYYYDSLILDLWGTPIDIDTVHEPLQGWLKKYATGLGGKIEKE